MAPAVYKVLWTGRRSCNGWRKLPAVIGALMRRWAHEVEADGAHANGSRQATTISIGVGVRPEPPLLGKMTPTEGFLLWRSRLLPLAEILTVRRVTLQWLCIHN